MDERKEIAFDNSIKSKLLDAEIKPPKGTWEAISSRLESKQNPRFLGRRWERPVWVGFCTVCASVAALLLFTPNKQSVKENQLVPMKIAAAGNPLVFDAAIRGEIEDLRSALPSREVITKIDKEECLYKEAPKTNEETPSINSKPMEEEHDEYTDPFADMIGQEEHLRARHKDKTSIKVGGVVGTNDAHSSGYSSHPKWTSGYSCEGVNENSISTYSIPVSLAVSARFSLTQSLSASVGLGWTMLNRYFEGSYKTASGEVSNTLHYIGIPINIYYNVLQKKSFQIYVFGGGSIEKCISNKYYILSESTAPIASLKDDSFQFGLKFGCGGTFNLSNLVSIYFDPYIGYYFADHQPKSIRTEHPLMFSFEAGVRFNL